MKRHILAVATAFSAALVDAGPLEFANKTVNWVSSPTANQDCFYFMLAGVNEADPGIPNQPWFAVPRTRPGFKEITAIILGEPRSLLGMR